MKTDKTLSYYEEYAQAFVEGTVELCKLASAYKGIEALEGSGLTV